MASIMVSEWQKPSEFLTLCREKVQEASYNWEKPCNFSILKIWYDYCFIIMRAAH